MRAAFSVTIWAWDGLDPNGWISEPIYRNGVSTGQNTPYTFPSVNSGETFSIPDTDVDNNNFDSWDSGILGPLITVITGGTYTAQYGCYHVTIQAYDPVGGWSQLSGLQIQEDTTMTSYTTPYMFTGLTGTHSFTLPRDDSFNYPLDHWSNGQTSITVDVSSGGTYSAYYMNPLTISISPSSYVMDVGQSKLFQASCSGGTEHYKSYQWYVDGAAVSGATSSTYSYGPVSQSGAHSMTAAVTDDVQTSSQSSPASISVNPALNTPLVSASLTTINQGQSSTLSLSSLSGGTTPYTYQWYSEAPGGSMYSTISGATSSTYVFLTSSSTPTGTWSFAVNVTDHASSPVSVYLESPDVTVNPASTPTPTPTSPPSWSIQTVVSSDVGACYLALDSSGNPHIAYYNNTDGHLKYASWSGSSWGTPQTVDPEAVVSGLSLALDSSGNPHIAYLDVNGTHSNLKYVSWSGSSWGTPQIVDDGSGAGWYCSLALDSSGNPHIAYYDPLNGLIYASWSGSAWSKTVVDSNGIVFAYCSLALDSSGNPHISYYYCLDSSTTYLKYASWTAASGWSTQTADSTLGAGWYCSLALDSSGNPHISYYDSTNKVLKYVSWSGSSWANPQKVDSTGDISQYMSGGGLGSYCSLALDSSGNPHISYYDATNGHLKYVSWSGSSWGTPQTVDSTAAFRYCSLALDSKGNPYISYYDPTNHILKLASVSTPPSPSPTPSPTPTPTPTPTPAPAAVTPSPTVTQPPGSTPTPAPTLTPSVTATPTPSSTTSPSPAETVNGTTSLMIYAIVVVALASIIATTIILLKRKSK